jgi:hypothetical protein
MFGFDRIIHDPDILDGKACIRGMRISVSLIVNLVANGMTVEEVREEYPDRSGAGGHPAGSALCVSGQCISTPGCFCCHLTVQVIRHEQSYYHRLASPF